MFGRGNIIYLFPHQYVASDSHEEMLLELPKETYVHSMFQPPLVAGLQPLTIEQHIKLFDRLLNRYRERLIGLPAIEFP